MSITLEKKRLHSGRNGRVSCVVVCHNEMEKIEAFFEFYRAAGVESFWFIDNGSTDGTLEFLLDQQDTSVFQTFSSYGADNKGLKWSRRLTDEYLDGQWVLTVDVDEVFVWPGYPQVTLKEYLSYCDKFGIEGTMSVMVDFFPVPGAWGSFRGQSDFLSVAPTYCKDPFKVTRARHFPFFQVKGGVRAVMIGNITTSPVLQKMPLMKWRKGMYYLKSTHYYSHVRPMSDMLCVLAHFKFSAESRDKFALEIERGQRWNKGIQYKRYLKGVEGGLDHKVTDAQIGRLDHLAELHQCGLLKLTPRYARYLKDKCRKDAAFVDALPLTQDVGFGGAKAYWSVLSRLNSSRAANFVDPSFAYDVDDVEVV
ncbi:MAG: glycosyltransferase family 2 protein [Chromatiaceae bacterium]|nr:glycosyltransferase family 2 protein [Gammaproteobacteria bacterium]MCP5414663.1 glycosyltransferase family 2 protein [Chromatiaceae bacterium]MCP5439064.1 glycosyltransferase family 2 protein [Chromatiaceae bacterium]